MGVDVLYGVDLLYGRSRCRPDLYGCRFICIGEDLGVDTFRPKLCWHRFFVWRRFFVWCRFLGWCRFFVWAYILSLDRVWVG